MAFSERYCDAATGSNLNGGFPIGGIYPVTSTNGQYSQGTGAGGTDQFIAAAGTPFSGCAAGDLVSSHADGAAAPTGFVGRVTAVNGGGASIDISLTAISGTRPTNAANGRTAIVGGAWAGPNGSVAFPFTFVTSALTNSAGDLIRVNFKSGTNYTVDAAITHANNGPMRWEGYTTTEGDGGLAKFVGQTVATSYIPLTCSGTGNDFRSLWFDRNGNSGTANSAFNITGTGCSIDNCRVTNTWRNGFRFSGAGLQVGKIEAHNCNIDDASANAGVNIGEECTIFRANIHHNDAGTDTSAILIGADASESVTVSNSILAFNGRAGIESQGSNANIWVNNCVIYGNGVHGVDLAGTTITTASRIRFTNCIFVVTAGFGIFNDAVGVNFPIVENCAFWVNGGSGATSGVNASLMTGTITLSGDPFTDAANGDFSLNNTAGAGEDCRAAGLGTWLQDSTEQSEPTISYPDLGPAQHEETAPGGGQTSYTFG